MPFRALTLAAALLTATGATAAPTPLEVVNDFLSQADRATRGANNIFKTVHGDLPQEGRQRISIDAPPGVYRIIGACDAACDDVDLRLYDDTGAKIEEDLQADKFPLIEIKVNGPATFEIEVAVNTCSTATCAFGVRIYRT